MTRTQANFFGDHLVNKGLISQQDLLDTLVDQVSRLPSIVEVFHQKQLLPCDKFLEVLRHQSENQNDFLTSLSALELDSAERLSKLAEELSRKRTPLGHLLIEKKKIDFKQLIESLDEFVQAPAGDQETTQTVPIDPVSSKISKKEDYPVAEPPPKAAPLLLNKFLSIFSGSSLDRFEETSFSTENLELCKKLSDTLASISAGARFIKFHRSQRLASALESTLRNSQSVTKDSKPSIAMGIRLLLEARDHMESHGNEDGFFHDRISEYEAILTNLGHGRLTEAS